MIGLLEAVEPATRIIVLRADRSARTHPLRERQRELVARGVQRVHCELFSPNDWLL